MKQANRRDFLKAAAASAVAVPYLVPGSALGADGHAAPSNRIVMGGIGIGNQGSGDQQAYVNRNDVQYVAACDVNEQHLRAALGRANQRYRNSDCKPYHDFRDLLARTDIDAVHVATPDHWHIQVVVEACRHGKDVYCQKPETRTLREGPLVVAAARRVQPRRFRRQPARAGRLPQDGRFLLERRIGADQVDQRQRRPAAAASATCPANRFPKASTGTCGSAPRPGRRTIRTVAAVATTSTGPAGVRIPTIRAAA